MGQPSPEPGSSVSVLDIRDRYGEHEVVPGKQTTNGGDGLPTVTQPDHEQPDIALPKDTDPPGELAPAPLIAGDGPEAEAGQPLGVEQTGTQRRAGGDAS